MHRVGLSSHSLSGISPEEQVFRKTSSIMRFGNLALSDHKVTVTAERQPPLEWRGGGEASACELGDRKISIALNEEPEPQWGNSITAPLRRSEPSGDVQHSLHPCTHQMGAPMAWSMESSTSLPPPVWWDVSEDELPIHGGGSQAICRKGTGDPFVVIISFPHYSLNVQRTMYECSQLLAGVSLCFGGAV